VGSAVGLGAALVPLRGDLNSSTPALVLIIPVVVGVVIGGFLSGFFSVAAGFLVYDYAFIRPYNKLTVGSSEDWVALVVYVVVMMLVARVVTGYDQARRDALRRVLASRRLFELSELLVDNSSVDELLHKIVSAVSTVFDVPGVSLLVLDNDRLIVAASAGLRLSDAELDQLRPRSGIPVSVGTSPGPPGALRTVALSAAGRPIGMLALRGIPDSHADRAVLATFANQAALALERAQLREQARRSELLEEVDRLRHVLLGAVSHDLRTPLATIRVASSTLYNRADSLSVADVQELHHLIEIESARLSRLVTNLLDRTRIEAGVLAIDPLPSSLTEMVNDALVVLGPSLYEGRVEIDIAPSLPNVLVDPLLIGQVLINLLENANRFAPDNTAIGVSAQWRENDIALAVSNQGPRLDSVGRDAIFDSFVQVESGGRAGLGLAIARTFVEAHGHRLWYEEAPTTGVRFVFTMTPVSVPDQVQV